MAGATKCPDGQEHIVHQCHDREGLTVRAHCIRCGAKFNPIYMQDGSHEYGEYEVCKEVKEGWK